MVVKTTLPSGDEVEAMIAEGQRLSKELFSYHFNMLSLWRQWLTQVRCLESLKGYVSEETVYAPGDPSEPGHPDNPRSTY